METKFTEEFTRLLVMKQEKNQHENHKQAMTNLHCNKDVQMQALTVRTLHINIFILYILHP